MGNKLGCCGYTMGVEHERSRRVGTVIIPAGSVGARTFALEDGTAAFPGEQDKDCPKILRESDIIQHVLD